MSISKSFKLSIVVPVYNEEEILNSSDKKLSELLKTLIAKEIISKDSFICYVDDGSKDKSWEIIKKIVQDSNNAKAIKLSRNYGHQNALLAGLFFAKDHSDAIVSCDADLQDDIKVIEQMCSRYKDGDEIVYGVRKSRQKDTFFKRATAGIFYKMMKKMGVELIENHADFRLMSKRAINYLKEFDEVNLFLRGLVPLIGLKSSIVYYERLKREAGVSKYPLKKMLSFAWQGITSFSVVPLKLVSILGMFTVLVAFLLSIWTIITKLNGNAIPGWASTVLPIYFIGGIQLLSLGIIGEYIGKIYQETKKRPRYFIDTFI